MRRAQGRRPRVRCEVEKVLAASAGHAFFDRHLDRNLILLLRISTESAKGSAFSFPAGTMFTTENRLHAGVR